MQSFLLYIVLVITVQVWKPQSKLLTASLILMFKTLLRQAVFLYDINQSTWPD